MFWLLEDDIKWPPASHRSDPSTSKRAEARVNATTRGTHAALVMEAVRVSPGLTALELCEMTRMTEYQVRRRLSDLRNRGEAMRYGERDGNSLWWPL